MIGYYYGVMEHPSKKPVDLRCFLFASGCFETRPGAFDSARVGLLVALDVYCSLTWGRPWKSEGFWKVFGFGAPDLPKRERER